MGEVFIARTPWDENPIAAVKRLRPDVARVPTFAERFRHEAELAVRLDHPNVVGTLDVGSVEGQLYVCSELVLGKDTGLIADRLRERGQGGPVAVAIRLLIDGLAGLSYVHGARETDGRFLALVHRDVTPGNLLVGYDGVVRVADFGLAKSHLTEKSQLTNHGEILGTPHYLAPEVIRGEGATSAADVYGLGAVLYRFLTGTAPHQGTTAEVLLKVLSEQPRPLTDYRPDLPPWFATLVARMMDTDQNRRPFDAALLLREVMNEARANNLLVPRTAVGRWLSNLFEVEHQSELEEYERVTRVDPNLLPDKTGTVVLARPRAESMFEAPLPMDTSDLDSLGTELDLSERQVREAIGTVPEDAGIERTRMRTAPDPETGAVSKAARRPPRAHGFDDDDGVPTRAINVPPKIGPEGSGNRPPLAMENRSDPLLDPYKAITDPDDRDTLDPSEQKDVARVAREIAAADRQERRRDSSEDVTQLPDEGAVAWKTDPVPQPIVRDETPPLEEPPPEIKRRPRSPGSVVVRPASAGMVNGVSPAKERGVTPAISMMAVEKSRGEVMPSLAQPQAQAQAPAPALEPPPPERPRAEVVAEKSTRTVEKPTVKMREPIGTGKTVAMLVALLVIAVALGVGIGVLFANFRGPRQIIVEPTAQVLKDKLTRLKSDMEQRVQRGEAVPQKAWSLVANAAIALSERNEAEAARYIDEVTALLAEAKNGAAAPDTPGS